MNLEVLVAGRGRDRAPVGAERRREDARVVGGRVPEAGVARVGPEADVVVREAVGREDLLGVRRPDERGHLRGRGQGGDARARGRGPADREGREREARRVRRWLDGGCGG